MWSLSSDCVSYGKATRNLIGSGNCLEILKIALGADSTAKKERLRRSGGVWQQEQIGSASRLTRSHSNFNSSDVNHCRKQLKLVLFLRPSDTLV